MLGGLVNGAINAITGGGGGGGSANSNAGLLNSLQQSQDQSFADTVAMQEMSTKHATRMSMQNAKFQNEMAAIKQLDAAAKAVADHMKGKAQDTKSMGQG